MNANKIDNDTNKCNMVISGISGRYPQSNNLEQLWSKILKGVPLITPDNTPYSKEWLSKVPKCRASLSHPDAFDADFFGFSQSYANSLDTQYRILHEVVYEAFWDAGILPESWRNTRTGFFVGSFDDDTEKSEIRTYDKNHVQLPFFATRISQYFDFKGPTVRVDTACASSISALRVALDNIQSGACDQAIVAGVCIHQRMPVTVLGVDLEMISPTGRSLCMDADADGYVRSEAVVAMILQRKNSAKRIYAEILSCVTNTDGYKPIGITAPSVEGQNMVIDEALKKADVKASSVQYVEAHMTGTQLGDMNECKSILKSYRNQSTQPILVGCLKSLLGHSEGASGCVAISKVVKIFQCSLIPPNAPIKKLNPRIDGLISGQIVPVLKATQFNHDIIPVNVFGFGGANGNVVLRASRKKCIDVDSINYSNQDFSRLILINSKTRKGLKGLVDYMNYHERTKSIDFIRLLDDLSSSQKMKFRSFAFLDHRKNITFNEQNYHLNCEINSIHLSIDTNCVNHFSKLIHLPPFKKSIFDSQIIINKINKSDNSFLLTVVGLLDLFSDLQIKINSVSGIDFNQEAEAYLSKKLDKQTFLTKIVQKKGKKLANGMDQKNNINCDQDLVLEIGSIIRLSSCKYKQTDADPLIALLKAFGIMYINGINVKISTIYPEFEYPVYRDCPSIGHLIDWIHDYSYDYRMIPEALRASNHSAFTIDLIDPEYTKISDHSIADKILFPATGFIYLIKKHLSLMASGSVNDNQLSLRIWNMRILSSAIIQDSITLHVNHDPANFKFTIKSNDNIHATGFASIWKNGSDYDFNQYIDGESDDIDLDKSEFYELLAVRGYNYGNHYQRVVNIKANRGSCLIHFDDDWMAFVDSFLQACIFWENRKVLLVPTKIDEFLFDYNIFHQNIDLKQTFKVFSCREGLIAGHGIVIKGLESAEFPMRIDETNLLIGEQIFSPLEAETINYDINLIKARENYLNLCEQICKNGKSDNIIDSFLENNPQATFLKSIKENVLQLTSKNGINQDNLSEKLLQDFVSDNFLPPTFDLISSQIDLMIDNKAPSSSSSSSSGSLIVQLIGEIPTTINNALKLMITNWGKKLTTINVTSNTLNQSKDLSDLSIIWHSSVNFCDFNNLTNSSTNIDKLEINGTFLLFIYRKSFTQFEEIFLRKLFASKMEEISSSIDLMNEKIKSKGYIQIGYNKIPELEIESIIYRLPHKQSTSAKSSIICVDDCEYSWIEEIKNEMIASNNENDRIWLISQASQLSGIIGLAKCLRLEKNGHRIRCVFVPSIKKGESVLNDDLIVKDLAFNVKLDTKWGFYRINPINQEAPRKQSPYSYLDIEKQGNWETLKWHENDQLIIDLQEGSTTEDDLIDVHYSAINFRDTLLASGRLPPKTYGYNQWIGFGSEFSGINQKGESICGLCASKAIATVVDSRKLYITIKVPDQWTLAQAATVPLCYSTIYYGLIVRGKMQSGETVLIHAGSGGIGLAAINVCLNRSCRVFTTVSSREKKDFVQKMFPQLDDSCFADSRSGTFYDHIMKQTNGRGVDLVVNFLTDKLLEAGMQLLAEHGRMIEIGKKDILENYDLDMMNYRKNVSLQVACLGWAVQNDVELKRIRELMENGMKSGEIKPLPMTIFNRNEVKDVFIQMGRAIHKGKLLIKMREDESERKEKIYLMSVYKTLFNPQKSFIIIGGLGGMGLQLVYWMISRGARKIVITSRSGIKSNVQRICLKQAKSLENKEITIKVQRVDVSNEKAAERLMRDAIKLGPIGGIFNLAAVLRDGLVENQTAKNFKEVCSPKIKATQNCDTLSRKHCPQLEYFVCFSSIASLGNLGQSNYGFANSFMERVCEKRQKDGLPALAVQWGPVGDVGMAHRIFGNSDNVAGFVPQKIASCMKSLDLLLKLSRPIGWSAIRAQTVKKDSRNALSTISRILGTKDINLLNPKLTLRELGMDSVQSVEVHSYLESNFDMPIATSKVYDITLEQIVKIVSISGPVDLDDDNENEKDTIFKPLKRTGSRPIFFFPPAVFDFLSMMPIALGMDRQVFGVEISAEIHDWDDWHKITDYVCEQILSDFPNEKTYDFFSYSVGAAYAFELARKIKKIKGENRVTRIVFIDSTPVAIKQGMALAKRLHDQAGGLKLSLSEFQAYLRRLDRQFGQKWRGNSAHASRKMYKEDEIEDPFHKYSYVADVQMEPKLKCSTLIFKAANFSSPLEAKLTAGLEECMDGSVEVIMAPGSHMDIMSLSKQLIIDKVNEFFSD